MQRCSDARIFGPPSDRGPLRVQHRLVMAQKQAAKHRRSSSPSTNPISLDQCIEESFERIERLQKSGARVDGLPTGFRALDEFIIGMTDGELIVVAGRPAVGKTSFALALAHYGVMHSGKGVLF